MTGSRDRNPFQAPSAPLEGKAEPSAPGAGWFWSGVFSLPVLAFAVLIGVAFLGRGPSLDGNDRVIVFAILALLAFLILLILGSGWWWGRRFSAGPWSRVFAFALLCGGVGQAVFIGGSSALSPLMRPGYKFSAPTVDDVLSVLAGWLGMSIYSLVQGLLIRWSLRKRSQAASR